MKHLVDKGAKVIEAIKHLVNKGTNVIEANL